MIRENEAVRKAARIAGVPLYRVAAEIGVSEPTLQRWLRFRLSDDKEARIIGAIDKLSQEVT